MDHVEDSGQRSIETIDHVITFNRILYSRTNIVQEIYRDSLNDYQLTIKDRRKCRNYENLFQNYRLNELKLVM